MFFYVLSTSSPLFFYSSQHRTRRQHHITTRTILIRRRPFGGVGGDPPTGSGAEPQRRAMAQSVVKLKVSMIWYSTKLKNMNRHTEPGTRYIRV